MVSDDELARHVEAYERCGERDGLEQRVERIAEHTRIVHDELYHRIESARANAATRDDLTVLVERLEDIESRLDELEADCRSDD